MNLLSMANFFPSLKASISNKDWFDPDDKVAVVDEQELIREEKEYIEKLKAEVNQGKDFAPFGKKKEKISNVGEDGDADNSEDDSNNGDIEEDTDEFETASPEPESGEDDMYGITSINEGDAGW
ncbi:anaphase-promoting complex subunit 15 [Hydra vulgaris]|uniref:Anaphase-promoting complex subunit 15 n=1 Tax=Hydra vulgaris TaxID=6087 RepID=A0ABM4CUZ6_HYDVU